MVALAATALLLYPVFCTALDPRAGHHTSCSGNLRQVAVAALAYSLDGYLPLPAGGGWCKALGPLVKREDVLQCPEATEEHHYYAMNRLACGTRLGTESSPAAADPAQTVLLFDAAACPNTVGGAMMVLARHSGGANVALCDGHVKWYREAGWRGLSWDPASEPATR